LIEKSRLDTRILLEMVGSCIGPGTRVWPNDHWFGWTLCDGCSYHRTL